MIPANTAGVKAAPVRTLATTSPRVGFQFIAVPAQLLRAGDLSFGAVILLGVVADAARQSRSGLCKLCNRSLGARIGRSESEVGRYLLELEAAGAISREFGRSKHVRAGIRLTWSEQVPESQGTASVQVTEHREPGSLKPTDRVPGLPEPIQSPPQSPPSDGPGSPSLSGKEAAAYLRRCVEAARRGEPMPEPPGVCLKHSPPPQAQPQPTPRVESIEPRPLEAPAPPPGVALSQVGRMVRSLAEGFKAEDVGRRRVGPAKLARQLSEMRRRHGRRE